MLQDLWIIIIIIAGVSNFLCGVLAAELAGEKGRSTGASFLLGFFLGIFGLIYAAGMQASPKQESEKLQGREND